MVPHYNHLNDEESRRKMDQLPPNGGDNTSSETDKDHVKGDNLAAQRFANKKHRLKLDVLGGVLKQAEDTGLEPATPCGATDFESASSPIRISSGAISHVP